MYYGFNPNKTAVTTRQKKLQITKWKERKHKKALLKQELVENEKEQRALKRRLLKKQAEAAKTAEKAFEKGVIKPSPKKKQYEQKVDKSEKSDVNSRKSKKIENNIEKNIENSKMDKITKNGKKIKKTAKKAEKDVEKSQSPEKSRKSEKSAEKSAEKPSEPTIETEIALLKLQRRQSELKVLLCDFDELSTESSMRNLNKDVDTTLRSFVPEPAPASAKKNATESEFSLNGFRRAIAANKKSAENKKSAKKSRKRAKPPFLPDNAQNLNLMFSQNTENMKNITFSPENEGNMGFSTFSIENCENTIRKKNQQSAKNPKILSKIAKNSKNPPGMFFQSKNAENATFSPENARTAGKGEASFGRKIPLLAQMPSFKRFGGAPSALQSVDIFSLAKSAAERAPSERSPNGGTGVEDSVQRIAARVEKTRGEAKKRFAAVPGVAAETAEQLETAAFAATASRCNFWFDDTDWHSFSPELEDSGFVFFERVNVHKFIFLCAFLGKNRLFKVKIYFFRKKTVRKNFFLKIVHKIAFHLKICFLVIKIFHSALKPN